MIRTVVFDLDGTLVQTEHLKGLSYARAAVEMGDGAVTEAAVMAAYRSVVGRSREEVASAIVERFGLAAPADADLQESYLALRLQYYEAMLADRELLKRSALERNIDLVHRAKAAGVKVGLCSMSRRSHVQQVVSALGLTDRFDEVVAREDVVKGKPDPEIYELILRKLGSTPLEAVAIEDSAAGVGAAVAAGMHCLAVPNELTLDGLLSSRLLEPQFIIENPEQRAHAFETLLRLRP